MSYNGWKNFETWNVKLWIDNEYAWYQDIKEMVEQMDEDDDVHDLAEQIENWFDMMFEDDIPKTGPLADLLNGAIREVDWREIAEAFLEE
jgi:hypothetical protein